MTFQPKRQSAPSAPMPRSISGTRPATVHDARAEAHALGGPAIARPSAAPTASLRKSILLVDPDANLRARLGALLAPYYDVIEANDGMEAIDLIGTMTPPAMIVTDTAMPRVDGFTLAKIIRNHPTMKRVPIMFVSAQDSPQHVTQALMIGAKQYLPKTTPVARIAEKIRKIVM